MNTKNDKNKQESLNRLRQFCVKKKLRLSEAKERVYEIILSHKKPVGAYDILDQLSKKMQNPKPPTVYRAVEFLQKHGFVHRIESLNAFVTCDIDHIHEGSQFMICDQCSHVTEAHLCHLPKEIEQKVKEQGFQLSHWGLELHGLCKDCQSVTA